MKNITDVGHMRDDQLDAIEGEDKIELAAETEGKSPAEIADFYTRAWLEDEALINILPVDVMPKATDHIDRDDLADRAAAGATASPTRSTARSTSTSARSRPTASCPARRSRRPTPATASRSSPTSATRPTSRSGSAPARSRLMKWPSPWGDGFPGWHIECSAMWLKHLGERFDVHTGGIDLKFPHHEDEIAQSEGALGHPVVSVWMHGEFLTMDEAKMAKSAGNIIRVAELPEKGYEPLAFRYLALTAHYRSKLDFTDDAMHAATSGLARLRRAAAGPDEPVDLSAEPMARLPSPLHRCGRRRPRPAPRAGDRPRGRRRRLADRCAAPRAAARLRPRPGAVARRAGRGRRAAARGCGRAARAPRRRARGRATSPRRTRCATSWRRWASRCATRPTGRRRPSEPPADRYSDRSWPEARSPARLGRQGEITP